MNEDIVKIIVLVLAFGAGLALGAFYFILLWRSVRKLPEAKSPARMMLGSFVLRMAVVLPGFYFIMNGHWERLVTAFIGFIIMRKILMLRLGQQKAV